MCVRCLAGIFIFVTVCWCGGAVLFVFKLKKAGFLRVRAVFAVGEYSLFVVLSRVCYTLNPWKTGRCGVLSDWGRAVIPCKAGCRHVCG